MIKKIVAALVGIAVLLSIPALTFFVAFAVSKMVSWANIGIEINVAQAYIIMTIANFIKVDKAEVKDDESATTTYVKYVCAYLVAFLFAWVASWYV